MQTIQTDQTDRQADRQTDKQPCRHAQTEIYAGRETDTDTIIMRRYCKEVNLSYVYLL